MLSCWKLARGAVLVRFFKYQLELESGVIFFWELCGLSLLYDHIYACVGSLACMKLSNDCKAKGMQSRAFSLSGSLPLCGKKITKRNLPTPPRVTRV